jgi:hypothetical protein
MTGREVMEMVDTLDRGSAEIARLRALNAELASALKVAVQMLEDEGYERWEHNGEVGPVNRMDAVLAKADQC